MNKKIFKSVICTRIVLPIRKRFKIFELGVQDIELI